MSDKNFEAGFRGNDAMRSKAEKMFGDLLNPKRAYIQPSLSEHDNIPLRKYKTGGTVESQMMEKLNRKKL